MLTETRDAGTDLIVRRRPRGRLEFQDGTVGGEQNHLLAEGRAVAVSNPGSVACRRRPWIQSAPPSTVTLSDTLISRLRTALGDRYTLQHELGAGAMATVFLARDMRHERDVAVKVLRPELMSVQVARRFLTEVRIAASLQHPHVLSLLDSGVADGLLYFVMPYVAGGTLRTRLTRDGPLPLREATRLVRQVADALHHAHARGVVHRDIKPENILMQDGHAVVADFGIALATQPPDGARLTPNGLSVGTPQYMSPEQAAGDVSVDARSDVYALGAVAYELMSGEPPFGGQSAPQVLARVLTETPRAITMMRPNVPRAVDAVIQRALAKLPADRWQTTQEFGAALAEALAAALATARFRASLRRCRWWAGVALMVIGVMLGARTAVARVLREHAALTGFNLKQVER
jgi:eukaryotic-like serine/threonine-protein kinase